MCSLESAPQTASRLVQPFFTQLIRVLYRQTDKYRDTQTTLHVTSVAIDRIFVLRASDIQPTNRPISIQPNQTNHLGELNPCPSLPLIPALTCSTRETRANPIF